MGENGLEGTGTFTIETSYPFVVRTIEDFAAHWSSLWHIHPMLNGTISHKINGQFTINRSNVTSREYTVSYSGTGTYHFEAEAIQIISGLVAEAHWDGILGTAYPPEDQPVSPSDITTQQIIGDGTVKLEYTTKLVAQ